MIIDLACPNCGRIGPVPRDKVNVRLLCKKCHMPFYLSAAGKAVSGDPPAVSAHGHAGKHGEGEGDFWNLNVPAVREKLVKGGAVVLAIGVIAFGYMSMGRAATGDLNQMAKRAATALANDSKRSLADCALSGTSEELDFWYETMARPLLDELRKQSMKRELISATLVPEDASKLAGSVQIQVFFAPKRGQSRNESLAREAGLTSPGNAAQKFTTVWVYQGGKWLLDGKQTNEASTSNPIH